MMCKVIFILIVCCFISSQEIIKYKTLQDIIGNAGISDIAQDSSGYIWISSGAYLYRYDSYLFKKYEIETSDSRPDLSYISSILVSTDNSIWLSTNAALYHLNQSTDKIEAHDFSKKLGLLESIVIKNMICFKDMIYLSAKVGIISFDIRTKQMTFLKKYKTFHPFSVSKIYKNKNKLLVGMLNGNIDIIDLITLKTKSITIPTLSNLQMIRDFIFIDGIYYVVTDNGLYSMLENLEEKSIVLINNKELVDGTYVYKKDSNELFISTDKGLYTFNNNTKFIEPYAQVANYRNYKIFKDNSGQFWLFKFKQELRLFKAREDVFKSYRSNIIVRTFVEDNQGSMWIGSEEGLFKYNEKLKKLINIEDIIGQSFHAIVTSLAVDSEGALWVGHEYGLIKIDLKKREYKSIHTTKGPVLAIYADNEEAKIWFGNFLVFDKKTNRVTQILRKYVTSIKKRDDESLWVMTTNGLFEYNKLNRQLNLIEGLDQKQRIAAFNKKNIFTSSAKSVQQFILKDSTEISNIISYDFKNNAAIVLNNNFLWMSSLAGITRFEITTGEIRTFTSSDGINPGYFWSFASYINSSNIIFFGMANGFIYFNPNEIPNSNENTRIRISNINIGNRTFNYHSNSVVELPYDNASITLNITDNDYILPKRSEYEYRISGSNSSWINIGTNSEINLHNLEPDNYTIKIRARDRQGLLINNEIDFNINVTPPFWLRNWFKITTILALLILLYLIYRFRMQRILEIDRIKQRISSDLHDDLGTSLTKISMYSQLLQANSQKNYKFISDIKRISIESIQALDDIVWTIDTRNDSMGELIARIEYFLNETFNHISINYRFHKKIFDMDKILSSNTRKHIYLIVKEAINNSIKHSGANTIQIKLEQIGNLVRLKISDNGKGIISLNNRIGNGLKNMHQRANQLDSRLIIDSNSGLTLELSCKI